MEFVSILRQLWRRKLLLFLVFLFAVVAAIFSAYKLPSMEKRSVQLGAAGSQILVDSPASTLVKGAQENELSTQSTRARIYAQYLASLEARDDIAKASGIPARAIKTAGPFSSDIPRNQYQPQPSEARANDVLKEGANYRLIFDAQDGVPIISVSAQAPTVEGALKLARASFVVLKSYVDKLQVEAEAVPVKPLPKGVTAAPVTQDAGVTVRQLGAPEGGTIGGGNSKIIMAFVFLAVMAFGSALIAIVPGMARHWRLLDRAEQLMDEPEAEREVVVGPDDPLRFGARAPLRAENGHGNGAADEAAGARATSAWR